MEPLIKQQATFFGKSVGPTLHILKHFSEFKATELMLALSKSTRQFLDNNGAMVARCCQPNASMAASLSGAKAMTHKDKKVLREHYVRGLKHVHDDVIFIAYRDLVFDLVDLSKLCGDGDAEDALI